MNDEKENRSQQENGAAHLEDRISEDEESLRKQRELWITSQGGKLCLELYAKFQEYRTFLQSTSFAARDPFFEWCRQPEHLMMLEALKHARDYDLERAERNRKNLEKARQAARCEHQYMDGEQCAAPRLKDGRFCRMHQGIEDAKAIKLDLGPLEGSGQHPGGNPQGCGGGGGRKTGQNAGLAIGLPDAVGCMECDEDVNGNESEGDRVIR